MSCQERRVLGTGRSRRDHTRRAGSHADLIPRATCLTAEPVAPFADPDRPSTRLWSGPDGTTSPPLPCSLHGAGAQLSVSGARPERHRWTEHLFPTCWAELSQSVSWRSFCRGRVSLVTSGKGHGGHKIYKGHRGHKGCGGHGGLRRVAISHMKSRMRYENH